MYVSEPANLHIFYVHICRCVVGCKWNLINYTKSGIFKEGDIFSSCIICLSHVPKHRCGCSATKIHRGRTSYGCHQDWRIIELMPGILAKLLCVWNQTFEDFCFFESFFVFECNLRDLNLQFPAPAVPVINIHKGFLLFVSRLANWHKPFFLSTHFSYVTKFVASTIASS
jgi:hypothetical protein